MRYLLAPVLAMCLCLAFVRGRAAEVTEKPPTAIAVIDFGYVDTSGEARDQHREHEARLTDFMRDLRRDVGQSTHFRLVAPACGQGSCAISDVTPGELVTAAREAGADIVLVGGVHKMSTLIQNAKIQVIDARDGRLVLERLFTFRGDTDEAWRRAEAFIVDDIATLLPR